jgi:hypothetical protein
MKRCSEVGAGSKKVQEGPRRSKVSQTRVLLSPKRKKTRKGATRSDNNLRSTTTSTTTTTSTHNKNEPPCLSSYRRRGHRVGSRRNVVDQSIDFDFDVVVIGGRLHVSIDVKFTIFLQPSGTGVVRVHVVVTSCEIKSTWKT